MPTAISLPKILAPIAPALHRVEERLTAQVAAFDPALQEYVQHALGGHGKRLRPALVLLSGAAAKGQGKGLTDGHLDLGVIVELIHLATLVHDDVMDQADLRHNQPTERALWGNETAILLGDCLFAQALKLAALFPTTEVCRCVSEATNTVCSGEILQTRRRFDPTLTIADYLQIIEMKTGALFAVSCDLGAYLSEAPPPARKALREFGMALGAAYQIFDDCVDIFGDESRAGKSLGTDLARGKLTLPMLIGLQTLTARQREVLVQDLEQGDPRAQGKLRQTIVTEHALEQALETFSRFLREAETALGILQNPAATRPLADAVEYLAQQAEALSPAAEPSPLAAVAAAP